MPPATFYDKLETFHNVIASNLGGLKEIVNNNETGFLFENKNDSDLLKKLEILVQNNKLRDDMGEQGLKRVKEFFSSEKYVRKIEELYNSFF